MKEWSPNCVIEEQTERESLKLKLRYLLNFSSCCCRCFLANCQGRVPPKPPSRRCSW